MTEAKRDANSVTTILATSNADGSTPVPVQANPTDHTLGVDDGTTGSDLSGDVASRDNNYIPVFMGVSSADGVTPCAVYADPATGKLLIKST